MRASESVSQLADSSCDQIRFMKSSNDYQGALFQVTCRRTCNSRWGKCDPPERYAGRKGNKGAEALL